ncbi:MAG: serine/threonine protein kinase [Myxococcales bacterium]|nr:serine/threonine protein kinase [Myxococcales bacterium]MCB9702068.1 serine/threonine protein kinase [Myxococcales bacterium]
MSNIEPTPFGDKYVLVEHIATGGMAEIYRAQYSGIEGFAKELVIKRLRDEFSARPSVVQMFLDEARVAATLTHNNVVHTYDLGELDGEYYIAMELLKGQELVAVLRRSVQTGYKIPMQIGLGIIMQALEGLHYVHTRTDEQGRPLGLFHRDINPTNIHVGYDGLCKIVDFGIAATRQSIQGSEGQFAGKLSYAAPEQILGHDLDQRADIFALGIVLYEMCLQRRLFRGRADEVANRIIEGDIPPPTFVDPNFPPALEAIIMKALEVVAAERYQNCDHMFRDLDKFTEEAGLRCTQRMISGYMAEMFGEGAPAEVNYDDQYDDLVDEALDFDRFDSLESGDADQAPDWAMSLTESDANRGNRGGGGARTIGNLEAIVAKLKVETEQNAAVPAEPAQPARGGRKPRGGSPSGRHRPVPDSGRRRPVGGTGSQRVVGGAPSRTGARVPVTATSSFAAVDPSLTSTGFAHGVMAEQKKKGGAVITWILVVVGVGGIAWIAYTMFTMK